MANKSKFLKNLLTTASAVAILTGGVQGAYADLSAVTGNATLLGVAAGTGGGAPALPTGRAFLSGDSLVYQGAYTLATGAAVADIHSIDLNGQVAGLFTVAHATSLGSVVNTGGAQVLAVTVNNGIALTLTGTAGLGGAVGTTAIAAGTYTGLGAITLGSGAAAGTLVIDTDATLGAGGTINSNVAAANGIVTINNNKTVVFNGIIGATKALATINVGGAAGGKATFNAAVTATKIDIKGAGVVVEIGAGVLHTGSVDSSVVGGTLKFLGAGETTGAIGATNALTAVIADNGKATLSNATHKAATFKLSNNANAEFEIKAGGLGKLDGNVDGTAANVGKLIFLGVGEVTGTIGATNSLLEVTSNGAAKVKLANGVSKATTLKLNNLAAEFEVAAGGVGQLVGNVDNITGVDNRGKLTFLGVLVK